MRLHHYFRIAGAIILGSLGWTLSAPLWTNGGLSAPLGSPELNAYRLIPAIVGGIIGALIFPMITVEPFVSSRKFLRQTPVSDLVAGLVGLILAGIITVIVTGPLSQLPGYFGRLLPIAVFLLLAWIFVELSVARHEEILGLVLRRRERREPRETRRDRQAQKPNIIMDTSAIIDGRIADISQTGFVWGDLIVPRFVLLELQHIADSSDALRRNRGRRGLDMLNRLQKESRVPVRVMDLDADGAQDVDSKLVVVAKRLNSAILTNDFNLNKVAEIQGVTVLNINELANAVKPVVLPGEDMNVQIIQEGKESGQGVAYLDDGTMVVVEGGRRHINATLDVTVTRVLQTVAGRMIFASPRMGPMAADGSGNVRLFHESSLSENDRGALLSAALRHGKAVVGNPVYDTIKVAAEGVVTHTLDRDRLRWPLAWACVLAHVPEGDPPPASWFEGAVLVIPRP